MREVQDGDDSASIEQSMLRLFPEEFYRQCFKVGYVTRWAPRRESRGLASAIASITADLQPSGVRSGSFTFPEGTPFLDAEVEEVPHE